jgi:hypothetical protein
MIFRDQVFFRSYDFAPCSLPLFLSLPVLRRPNLLPGKEGGRGGGQGAESYDSEKSWPYINHSILSGGMKSLSFRHV